MRVTPLVLVLGLAASTVSVPGLASFQDRNIAPKSVELLEQGKKLRAEGKLVEADSVLETALVIDPKNRAALIEMARVSLDQELHGEAIRLTRRALIMNPNDRDALAVQGEAMIELGALQRAKKNRDRIAELCPSTCDQVARLDHLLERGAAMAQAERPAESRNN